MLHVFDLDGTLLRGTTASIEIARTNGTLSDLHALEADFAAGALDTKGFAQAIGALWRGLDDATVEAAFCAAPFMSGIERVVADIAARGERSALITMTPTFFADRLSRFGFDHIAGSVFPSLPLVQAPNPDRILVPESKVHITDDLLAHYGFDRSSCMAYGDSLSDMPLFATLTRTVAINASEALCARSSMQYRGNDLWEAYTAARNLTAWPN
ncbi:haloacid dehalogenase-like hydrolase [Leucobacter sp. cx-42]|uniref:HAD family hydrolase n=1 Tax=unclassified Leucobacter TaxID=2621730 RepID=UPI00165DFB23|nr:MULTISPECIES: haloacid dehalogenase-like hydrolase [unclassified Leucobacter]MBC9954472.1 haloacid dehalogenase-like hydrolase [Leucobacter sp. cx-42]